MKVKFASVAAALLATASLQAQSTNTTNFVEGPAALTLSLTLKSSIPGTVALDALGKPVTDPTTKKPVPAYEQWKVSTNSAGDPTRDDSLDAGKIANRRYGSSELLRDLLAAGALGQAQTNITGWGIFSISRGEEGSGETTLVARRVTTTSGQATTNDVSLEGILDLTVVPVVSNFSFSETITYNYSRAGELISTVETGRGSFSDEGIAYLEFANQDIGFTGSIAGTTMTVNAVTPRSANLAVGMIVRGTGVQPDTIITSLLGATGGVGTYTVSRSNSITVPAQLTAETLPAAPISGFMTESGSEFRWYPTSDKSEQESVLISGGVNITGLIGVSEPAGGESVVLVTGSASLGRTSAIRAPSN